MRKALRMALVVTALTTSSLLAQKPAAPPNPFGEAPARLSTSHLSVAIATSPAQAAPGGRVTVSLDVTPRRTMHVYAPGKHDYQVVQFTIDEQPWLTAGPTRYPSSERYYFEPLDETVEVYSAPFRLTREVTLLDTPAARAALAGRSSVAVTGTLAYQACDDRVCYSPTKVPVRVEVRVKR
jgi:hypothetical protein